MRKIYRMLMGGGNAFCGRCGNVLSKCSCTS